MYAVLHPPNFAAQVAAQQRPQLRKEAEEALYGERVTAIQRSYPDVIKTRSQQIQFVFHGIGLQTKQQGRAPRRKC